MGNNLIFFFIVCVALTVGLIAAVVTFLMPPKSELMTVSQVLSDQGESTLNEAQKTFLSEYREGYINQCAQEIEGHFSQKYSQVSLIAYSNAYCRCELAEFEKVGLFRMDRAKARRRSNKKQLTKTAEAVDQKLDSIIDGCGKQNANLLIGSDVTSK